MPAGIGYGQQGLQNLSRLVQAGRLSPQQAQQMMPAVLGGGGGGVGPPPPGARGISPPAGGGGGGNPFSDYLRAPLATEGAVDVVPSGGGGLRTGVPGLPPGASPDMGFGPIMALLMEHLRRQQQQQQYGAGRAAMRQALTGQRFAGNEAPPVPRPTPTRDEDELLLRRQLLGSPPAKAYRRPITPYEEPRSGPR